MQQQSSLAQKVGIVINERVVVSYLILTWLQPGGSLGQDPRETVQTVSSFLAAKEHLTEVRCD